MRVIFLRPDSAESFYTFSLRAGDHHSPKNLLPCLSGEIKGAAVDQVVKRGDEVGIVSSGKK